MCVRARVSFSHQRPSEISLSSRVVDARKQLVEVRPFVHCLLPESVSAAHVSGGDDLQQGLVLYSSVFLEGVNKEGGRGRSGVSYIRSTSFFVVYS